MEPKVFQAMLGRELQATDQPPGTYRYRAQRGAPWQAVRINYDGLDKVWHCFVNGMLVHDSGQPDPQLIPFINKHAPFFSITEKEYELLIQQYNEAKSGTPLKGDLNQPVDLRKSEPL